MGVLLVLVFGVCLLAGTAAVAWLGTSRSVEAVSMRPGSVPAAAGRRTAIWRLAGLLAGLAAGGAAAESDALGRGLLLAGPVFGVCVLAGVVTGELSVRPASGQTRMAVMEIRRVRDYLPRGLATTVAAAAAVLAALVTVTTATARPDDLGRAGRVLLLGCGRGLVQSAEPWPGSFYSVPLAVMVAVGLIAGGGALRVVIRRARTGAAADEVAADDTLRARAARTITGGCGILVAVPLAGICLVSAGAMLSISCRPAWWTFAGWALLALLLPILALICWCTEALLAPARAITIARPAR